MNRPLGAAVLRPACRHGRHHQSEAPVPDGRGAPLPGGIVGPQIFALIKDKFAENAATYSFYTGAAFLAVGLVFSLLLNDNKLTPAETPKSA